MNPVTKTHDALTMRKRGSRGFTLIEVLVALVVVSVGMLGIAGLYVHGMQAGRTAMFSHQAVTLAGDIADRIRANPTAGATYAGDGADNSCVAGDVDCDATEMAEHDIFLWQQQAAAFLPNGNVVVAFAAGTPPQYTITVNWTEPGEARAYVVTIPVFGS